MRKSFIALFVAIFAPFFKNYELFAQKSWEFGLSGGSAVYQGETNPSYFSLETFNAFNPEGGLLLRYNMSSELSLEANLHYGTLSGNDKDADTNDRRTRNLSFKTDIITFGVQANYNLFGFQPFLLEEPFSPYIFVGVEGFHFNPKAEYNGQWHELQPLGTEGQGMSGRANKYSLNQLAIPFGFGFRYAVTDRWAIGFEAGLRKTFTDYIDDVGGTYVKSSDLAAKNGQLAATLANRTGEVGTFIDYRTGSQRGGRNDDDWYAFTGLTISHIIYDDRLMTGMRRSHTNRKGCPAWKRKKSLF
ncbi:MAG: hypothetical protein RI894_267 [Bacteroidota bacterium]